MGVCRPRRALLAAALLAVGCYSPTLPLPPPSDPEVSAIEGTNRYRLVGVVEPRAEVLARNRRTRLIHGQLTGVDGRYDFEVEGEAGDRIELWYVIGDDASQRNEFPLPSNGSGTEE